MIGELRTGKIVECNYSDEMEVFDKLLPDSPFIATPIVCIFDEAQDGG